MRYHLDISDVTFTMMVDTTDYATIVESIDALSQLSGTITNTAFTMTTETYEANVTDSYINYVVDLLEDQHITLGHSESFDESISLSCTTDSLSTLTYALVEYQSQPIPSWVSIDFTNGKITGTAPYVSSSTQYVFAIDITGDDFDGTQQKVVYVNVQANADIDQETSTKTPQITSQQITTPQIMSLVSIAITATITISNASSLGLVWSIINQLQMLVLLLFLPTYIKEDVRDHIIRHDFTLMKFSFLSLNKIPIVKNMLEHFGDEIIIDGNHDGTMKDIELESESVISNLLSLIFVFVLVILLHLLLKFIPAPQSDHQNKLKRLWAKTKKYILESLKYSLYVRLILECHQVVFI